MTGKRIPSELIEKYTANAKKIIENQWGIPFDELKKALDANREKFFEELENI